MKSLSKIFLLACLTLTSTFAFSQEGSDKVYRQVERMPQFPGGAEAMGRFVGSHLKYPKSAKADVVVRVAASFVVNEDGSLSDAKITKSAGPDFDVAVLQVLESMPHWMAGRQNGTKVKCALEVPFRFDRAAAAE